MSHLWERQQIPLVNEIIVQSTGKKSDVHLCSKCRQIALSPPGGKPILSFTEDCDTMIVKNYHVGLTV